MAPQTYEHSWNFSSHQSLSKRTIRDEAEDDSYF